MAATPAAQQPQQQQQVPAPPPQQLQQQQQQQQQAAPKKQQEQKEGRKMTLEELYLSVRDKPLHVADVRIEGIARGGTEENPSALRLKREILDRELDRVYEAKTLKEVHEALERCVEVLRQLEVFEDITAVLGATPLHVPDACSVNLQLTEAKLNTFKAGTYTQGGEYSVEVAAGARNVLGIADHWTIAGEIGTRNSRNFAAAFRLPRAGGSSWTPEVRLAQVINNQQLYCSWQEAFRGISLGLTSPDVPGMFLGYEYGWRNLRSLKPASNLLASHSVHNQAGDYLKAALKGGYIWSGGGWQQGDPLSTEGYNLRVSSELGGAAPYAEGLRYLKTQAHLSWAARLTEVVSFHLEAGAGVLLPGWTLGEVLAKPGQASPLPERFYLGGVESNLRGFDLRGIGPSEPRRRSGGSGSTGSSGGSSGGSLFFSAADAAGEGRGIVRDALGGDLFSNLYAGLMVRLPGQVGDLGVHAHVFANGGSQVLLSGSSAAAAAAGSSGGSSGGVLGELGRRLRGGLQEMGSSYRWSAGVGLVWPMVLGRLEVNYCWVLTSQEHDRLRRGFSFGFASNMGL